LAAIKVYYESAKPRQTYSTGRVAIYPKSIRSESYSNYDEWDYSRNQNEWYVGGKNLQDLLADFEVDSTKALVAKIETDEAAILRRLTNWIAINCPRRRGSSWY
jgi:hypothetical protein